MRAFMRRHPYWVAFAAMLMFCFVALQFVGRVIYRPRLPEDRSVFTNTDVQKVVRTGTSPHRLVVVFHGVGGRALPDVRAAIQTAYPDADLLVPQYSSSWLNNEDPLEITREFLRAIDRATKATQYDSITLVGYSLGALLARKVVVCAYTGCRDDYADREFVRDWRTRIDRVVLLAGMNRGWATHCEKVQTSQAAGRVGYERDCRAKYMKWHEWLGYETGQRLGPTFGVGGLINASQRGAPFVANLRLEWLRLEQHANTLPLVIQLLGDIDAVVSRADTIDEFVTSRFIRLRLSATDHTNVIDMNGNDGLQRKATFIKALTASEAALRIEAGAMSAEASDFVPDPSVTRVVFILHGIRDDGEWTLPLGDLFTQADPSIKVFAKSYGYFSALHFLMPDRMRANVRWFVDQYTELKALYPRASFDFIGHSNGTYILSQSLDRYHGVTFNRVAFAGSVVPTTFPWSAYSGRITAIRNYRASNDLIVAALPSVFEHIPWFLEVGGAGHAGFLDDFARQDQSRFFADGGHDAVLGHKDNHPALVKYILGLECPPHRACDDYELPANRRTTAASTVATLAYRFCVVLWSAAIVGIGRLAYFAMRKASVGRQKSGSRLAAWTRSAVAGVSIIGIVLMVLLYA